MISELRDRHRRLLCDERTAEVDRLRIVHPNAGRNRRDADVARGEPLHVGVGLRIKVRTRARVVKLQATVNAVDELAGHAARGQVVGDAGEPRQVHLQMGVAGDVVG